MKDKDRTKEQLLEELGKLRQKLRKLEDAEAKHKQKEQLYKESEEKYKLLVETSNDMIFTVDLGGNFLFVNQALKKILGYSREDIKKINGFALVHPEDLSRVRKQFAGLVEGKKVNNMEYRYKTKKGNYIHILNNASPIFSPEGNIVAAFGIARDITQRKKIEEKLQRAHDELELGVRKRTSELVLINKKLKKEIEKRKRTEQALRESEEKYRSIFESFQDVYYKTDREGRVTIISPSVYSQAGYDPKEMIGKPVTDFYLNPADREAFLQELKKSGVINDYELKLKANNGRVIEASANSRIIFNKDGEPMGVEGVLRDITGRKQAEEALRESEEKYREIVELAPDGILTIDLKGVITSCNTAFLNLAGVSKANIIGKHFTKLPRVRPRDIHKYIKMFNTLLKEKTPKPIEIEWHRKDGTTRSGEFHVSLMKKGPKTTGIQVIARDITERKRTRQVLEESEEKFRNLAEQSPNMIFINKKGRVVYANKKCAEIMGYKREEFYLPDFDFLTLIAPESRELIRASFKQHMKGQDIPSYEYTLITRDGQRIEAIITTRLINYDGERAILGIITDITERKRTEQELSIKDWAIKSSISAIALADLEGNFIYVNDSFLQLWGYENENEVIGKPAIKFWRSEEEALKITKALHDRWNWIGELEAIKKDGSTFDAQLSASMVTDANGNPICMMASSLDITEHKIAEEKYSSLYSAMNEGVCLHEIIYDNKGKAVDYRFIDINPAYELITGLKKEKVIGSKASQIYRTANPPFLNIFAKAAETGEPASIESYFPPLKKYFIISTFSPEKGKFATVHTDITERYETERELIDAKEQAETALRKLKRVQSQLIQSARLAALGKLSAGIAHEINNPLSIISGHAQILLMDKIADSPEIKEPLETIKKQVDRASSITDQLLQFSKRIKPRLKKSNVNETLKDTLVLLRQQLSQDKIKIVKKLSSKPAFIRADASQLQQVFMNLISNASHAMPNGGTLTIDTTFKDGNLETKFTDTGCGIPERNLSKIFEPFFTTKKDGTGLGLSIAYGIIKAHKGDIKVKSEEGKGTTFIIILPYE
ncbi:MAG: PAS domain S-box protein [Candidatus Aminicenantes bacterium]|nr:PAS domain S-box protein [Candidatus Aminicenantes bacterium]